VRRPPAERALLNTAIKVNEVSSMDSVSHSVAKYVTRLAHFTPNAALVRTT
jgi:hypothetical protein